MAAVNGAVAVQSSVPLLCASKFVTMLCMGFFTLTTQAMISDMCMAQTDASKGSDTSKLVSSVLGVQMALTGLGFLFGIIGAGMLSDKLGLSAIFGASATISALTASAVAIAMPETLAQRVTGGTKKLISWKKLLTSPIASAKLLYSYGPQVRTLAILLMLMSIPSNQGDFLQIYAKTEWDLSIKMFSSYLALCGMVGSFANGFGSQLVKKMGVKKFTSLAIISRCITASGTAFFGYRGSVIGWIVGFLGAAQSIGIVAALVSAGAKSGLPQGELAGERSSLLALLKVVGPIWYSMLYIQGSSRFGLNNFPFIFNIGLCAIAFIVAQTSLKGDEITKAAA
jgi:MFS family permease